MRYMDKRRGKRRRREDEDPLSGVANLFDVAMVFALGLMVMILMYAGMTELLTSEDITIVKNPGQRNMEVIVKSGEEIEKLNITEELVSAEGVKIGTIYQTKGGGMIYIPENGTSEGLLGE